MGMKQIINISYRIISCFGPTSYCIQVALGLIAMRRGTKRDTITASEISQYVYCPIAWYRERCGSMPKSPSLKRGTDEHTKAGKRLSQVQSQEMSLKIIRFLEYLMLIGAVALWWFLRSHI